MKQKSFAGNIVLGLNDALIELSGVLVGLTLAFQDSKSILVAGLLTGVAASLSMGASSYLQAKQEAHEGSGKHPVTSASYTGLAYILTSCCLLLPFLLLSDHFLALGVMVGVVFSIIAGFTYYVSVLRKQSFIKNFFEMAAISTSIGLVSFVIGYFLQGVVGV